MKAPLSIFLLIGFIGCHSFSDETTGAPVSEVRRLSVTLERALERIEQEKGPLPSQSSILLKLRSACSPSQIANDCILVDVRRSLPPRSVEDERFAEVLIDKDTQQIYEVH